MNKKPDILPEKEKNRRLKISKALKGRMPKNIDLIKGFNKGKHIVHSGSFKNGHPSYWTDETKKIVSEMFKGNKSPNWTGKSICKCGKKKTHSAKNCMSCSSKINRGELHHLWKGGTRKINNERNDSAYQNWVKKVKKRDNWKCRMENKDCNGYCIVHHILSWRDYPELRYKINNGITLCQAHHPLKRAEEKRLVPFFQGLVPVSK